MHKIGRTQWPTLIRLSGGLDVKTLITDRTEIDTSVSEMP